MDGGPTEKAVAKFLAYFEAVKQLHVAELGKPLEMYKTTDAACLAAAFHATWMLPTRAATFVADLVNTLVWSQCLGNGNHRTTVLFVRTFLEWAGVEFPASKVANFEKELHIWVNRSQALIRRRGEPGYAQARLAPRHREITGQWVDEMLPDQSGALMIMGPQRLIDFISASERSG